MNDQTLQLLISLAEVAAMVGLCAALFGTADRPIAGTDALAARLASEVADFRAGASILSRDSGAGLIEDASGGRTYLVVARGADLVTRKLSRDVLESVTREGSRLRLKLSDFTLGRAALELCDDAQAREWETRLERARA